jgi:DNA-binding CsgD family transcriptional regulator
MTTILQRKFSDIPVMPVPQAGYGNALVPAPGAIPGIDIGTGVAITDGLALARAAADAFGLVGLPAAVLSRSHRLVAANDLMEKLIPQVVQHRRSRIGLADRRADAMLAQSLLEMQDQASEQVRSVPVAATPGMPASIVRVVPLRGAANDVFTAASYMLTITSISRPEIVAAEIIQDLFDLTPAEARVARGIAAGKTVHDLADEAGLAAGTVRQQLKSVFSKTGVSRQADLVGLLVGTGLSFGGNVPRGTWPELFHGAAASRRRQEAKSCFGAKTNVALPAPRR